MEKLKMITNNGVEDNISKISSLFPNCVTETTDAKGKSKLVVDFDKLRQELSDEIIEGKGERYEFVWPSKKNAILLANSPIKATLRPCVDESEDFANTQNLYIEGDNLDVLKCLKETYLGKVKMIYIDPPYNTGKDFVYNDDFAESVEDYMANSGQYDDQGNRLVTNTESNGRFHTDWLNMIYPRIKVARDLLSEDGVIFISIDDNEVDNLRKVCDEIFGADNFVSQLIWEKKKKPSFLNANIGVKTEYILCYSKKRFSLGAMSVDTTEEGKKYPLNNAGNSVSILTFPPKTVRFNMQDGVVERQDMSEGNIVTELLNDLIIKNGVNDNEFKLRGEWRYSQEKVDEIVNNQETLIISKIPFRPNHVKAGGEIKKMHNLLSIANYSIGTNEDATAEQISLLGKNYFDYAKPSSLIHLLIKSVTYNNSDTIILDFFSGTATAAHAVMQLNAEDGGNRKFIMVQLPEITYEGEKEKYKDKYGNEQERYVIDTETNLPKVKKSSEALEAGFPTICEIGKERIRRASKKIKEDSPLTTQNLDTGFRVLKLDSSNMEDVYYAPAEVSQGQLFSYANNIKADRTHEDLLFQTMLELGATLDSKIEKSKVCGKEIFNVADGYIVACFDSEVSDDVVKAIAQMQPLYAVLRDSSLANDSTATNFEQIFKTYSPSTTCKIL